MINWTEFWIIILNGMDITHFFAYYTIALSGILIVFAYNVGDAVKYDRRSPDKFSWKRLFSFKMVLRFIINLLVLFYVITNMEAFAGSVVDVKLALLSGIGIDGLTKTIIGAGPNTFKKIRMFILNILL